MSLVKNFDDFETFLISSLSVFDINNNKDWIFYVTDYLIKMNDFREKCSEDKLNHFLIINFFKNSYPEIFEELDKNQLIIIKKIIAITNIAKDKSINSPLNYLIERCNYLQLKIKNYKYRLQKEVKNKNKFVLEAQEIKKKQNQLREIKEILSDLIKNGADIHFKNKDNKSPLDKAIHSSLKKFLLNEETKNTAYYKQSLLKVETWLNTNFDNLMKFPYEVENENITTESESDSDQVNETTQLLQENEQNNNNNCCSCVII